jgi:hypothetical protein
MHATEIASNLTCYVSGESVDTTKHEATSAQLQAKLTAVRRTVLLADYIVGREDVPRNHNTVALRLALRCFVLREHCRVRLARPGRFITAAWHHVA